MTKRLTGKERRELRRNGRKQAESITNAPARKSRTPWYLAAAGAVAIATGGLYAMLKLPTYLPLSESAIYKGLAEETKAKNHGMFILDESVRPPLPNEVKEFEHYFFTTVVHDPRITRDPFYQRQVAHHHGNLPMNLDSVYHVVAVRVGVNIPSDFFPKTRQMLDFLVDFLDEPLLKDISVVVPTSVSEINRDGTGTIYVVDKYAEFIQTKKFYVKDFEESNLAPFTNEQSNQGVVDSHLDASSGTLKLRQIYVTLDPEETVAGYNLSVSAEGVHFALNKRSQALFKKAAAEKTLNPAEHERIIHEEEVFVHAVHFVATQYFLEKQGMDAASAAHDIEKRVDYFDGIPKYRGVERMFGTLAIPFQPDRSLEERMANQKQRVAAWKQHYLSGDRTMFEFLHE